MENEINCDNYSKCKNSSTGRCFNCRDNKNIKSYFEEVKPCYISTFNKAEEIIGVLDKLRLNTKIEIKIKDMIKIGFLIRKHPQNIMMEVDRKDRFIFDICKIETLKIIST